MAISSAGIGFDRQAGFFPGLQAAADHRAEHSAAAEFLRYLRASGVAIAGAVDEDVLVDGKIERHLIEGVRIEPARALHARGVWACSSRGCGRRTPPPRQPSVRRRPRSGPRTAPSAIRAPCSASRCGWQYRPRGRAPSSQATMWPKASYPRVMLLQRVAEEESDSEVSARIEHRADRVEADKLAESHIHTAGQRRRHGVNSRHELGEHQQRAPALVEGVGRPQDAGFRIERQPAQNRQQPPAGVPAQQEHQAVAGGDAEERSAHCPPGI